MSEDINSNDVGQHYIKLNAIGIPDEDIGPMLRRFVSTYACLIVDEDKQTCYCLLNKEYREEDT